MKKKEKEKKELNGFAFIIGLNWISIWI